MGKAKKFGAPKRHKKQRLTRPVVIDDRRTFGFARTPVQQPFASVEGMPWNLEDGNNRDGWY